jgi:hypothetical protein
LTQNFGFYRNSSSRFFKARKRVKNFWSILIPIILANQQIKNPDHWKVHDLFPFHFLLLSSSISKMHVVNCWKKFPSPWHVKAICESRFSVHTDLNARWYYASDEIWYFYWSHVVKQPRTKNATFNNETKRIYTQVNDNTTHNYSKAETN